MQVLQPSHYFVVKQLLINPRFIKNKTYIIPFYALISYKSSIWLYLYYSVCFKLRNFGARFGYLGIFYSNNLEYVFYEYFLFWNWGITLSYCFIKSNGTKLFMLTLLHGISENLITLSLVIGSHIILPQALQLANYFWMHRCKFCWKIRDNHLYEQKSVQFYWPPSIWQNKMKKFSQFLLVWI